MLWGKAVIIMAVQICFEFLLGRALIPLFRKIGSGKLDLYIGDRFKHDKATPKFGGVLVAGALALGIFPAIAAANAQAGLGGDVMLTAVVVAFAYSLLMMTIGILEDWSKIVSGTNAGLKTGQKIAAEFVLNIFFLIMLRVLGAGTTKILLPFRMGYAELGELYYPIMAVFMTLTVNAVKVHDCFAGDTKSSIDGLCASTIALFALVCGVCGSAVGSGAGQAYAYCIAGAAAGYLLWGLSPAKIYLGESGGLLLGGLAVSLVMIIDMPLVIILAGLAFCADGVCSALQFLIYRRNKKFLFKAGTLHGHFSAKGWSDYKIIAVSALVTCAGGAAAIAYAVYSTRLM